MYHVGASSTYNTSSLRWGICFCFAAPPFLQKGTLAPLGSQRVAGPTSIYSLPASRCFPSLGGALRESLTVSPKGSFLLPSSLPSQWHWVQRHAALASPLGERCRCVARRRGVLSRHPHNSYRGTDVLINLSLYMRHRVQRHAGAFRAESDTAFWIRNCSHSGFQSTHPRGVRLAAGGQRGRDSKFSIHAPAGGATICKGYQIGMVDFSIHAPAGGATFGGIVRGRGSVFSIHALQAESDQYSQNHTHSCSCFQSTPSGRRATRQLHPDYHQNPFSIHALRAESDGRSHRGGDRRLFFNPRPPGGERLQKRRKILFFAQLGWRISNYIFILLHFLPDEKEFFYFFPLFLSFFPII